MKRLKRIVLFLIIWILIPFGLLVGVSCSHHHFGGSKNELSIRNKKEQAANISMRLYREYPWYSRVFNPIIRSYHPLYLAQERLIEGKITLEHIHDGDILRLYVRRDLLPLQFTFQGEEKKEFSINWELIGKELDEHWENQCLWEKHHAEEKRFTLLNPQNAGITLIWKYQDGQWEFQSASWVEEDRYSLQKYDRDGEKLSNDAA